MTSSAGITTSFGYDPAGNQTAYIDGNGNLWGTTYNSWNLPQTQVEPSTSTYSTPANSTTTIAYNGDREQTAVTEPGGVTQTYTYDSLGDLKSESGSGRRRRDRDPDLQLRQRRRHAHRRHSSTAASGQPSNATSETFTYDDRGLLTDATGSAGYHDSVQRRRPARVGPGPRRHQQLHLRRRRPPADDGRPGQRHDPDLLLQPDVPGVARSPTARSADAQSFGYNSLHQLTSDTLASQPRHHRRVHQLRVRRGRQPDLQGHHRVRPAGAATPTPTTRPAA